MPQEQVNNEFFVTQVGGELIVLSKKQPDVRRLVPDQEIVPPFTNPLIYEFGMVASNNKARITVTAMKSFGNGEFILARITGKNDYWTKWLENRNLNDKMILITTELLKNSHRHSYIILRTFVFETEDNYIFPQSI